MPPKIAIQTTHVRGGTLNSPPFLEFLSSPLDLLSSGILNRLRQAYHDQQAAATGPIKAAPSAIASGESSPV